MNDRRKGIIAGGNWLLDHVKVIDHYPAQDALATIVAQSEGNGGGPYNMLKDLARLKVDLPLEGVGLVGNDADGASIIQDCRDHGIDTTQLHTTDAAPTSFTDVMSVRDSGRRTFFHQRGANALLSEEHFSFAETEAAVFHLAYLMLLDTLEAIDGDGSSGAARVLRAARSAGLLTSLDFVSLDSDQYATLAAPVLPEVDVLVVNEYEAGRLTGTELAGDDGVPVGAAVAAAETLLARGVQKLVVIHFTDGVVVRNDEGRVWRQGSVKLPGEQIKGANGAGDAFAAGLLYGLHQGWPVQPVLESAVCVAAACLTDATTSAGVRPFSDCLELGRQHGFRTLPKS